MTTARLHQAASEAADQPITLREPIVVTGIGLIASNGQDRESVWAGVRTGRTAVRRLEAIPGFADGELLGATVDWPGLQGRLKVLPLCNHAAAEALADAEVAWDQVDRERFGCSVSAHMGDARYVGRLEQVDPDAVPAWWTQWLPNTACAEVARRFGLLGPRYSHSTACASSLISILRGVRAIQDGECDLVLAGGGDAIDPLFAAGFRQMRVLAEHHDPQAACRPFDRDRNGFVMGEGAAMIVIERLRHALARNARIYAEIRPGAMLAQAHHVTGLDAESDALVYLLQRALAQANLDPREIGYINAHGTGTQQNDIAELRGFHKVLGDAAGNVCVSATKSVLGHMVNAAGGAELAITLLAMRDGFAPPTLNLDHPDPECPLDCLPHVGRVHRFQHALKTSVAFGGHLVAVAVSRWNDERTGYPYAPVQTPVRKAA